MWWLPMPKPPVPVHLVVGSDSVFLKEKFPQVAKRKLAIPFSIVNGGHMFPLEHPRKTIEHVKSLII
jgi:carboxypeptidase C (cathepsin A)